MNLKTIAGTVTASALITLGVAGCGSSGSSPTPAAPPFPPSSEFVVPPPNFVGLWTFCNHGNRVYETADPAGSENTSQVTVSPNDPSCRGVARSFG